MTTGQKKFNFFALVWGILSAFGLVLLFLAAPNSDEPQQFNLIAAYMAVHMIALITTATINLIKNKLILATTVIQIVFYCLTVWLIPFGIVGIVLLVKREKVNG